jgi:hypothetical protein
MKRKGSIAIVAVLIVSFALIGVAAILTATYLNGYQFESNGFRGTVTQFVSSSRGAVVMATADISKQLDLRVKTYPPSPYYDATGITLTTSEKNEGNKILGSYQNNTRISYPGTGLLINFIGTVFDCNWTNTEKRTGYTISRANITIDMPNLGFHGLTNYVKVETNATLKNLINTDGRILSFTMSLDSEGHNPIDNLDKNLVRVYYANFSTVNHHSFTEFTVNSLSFTNGTYLITCGSEFDTINANIANLTTKISAITDANFTSTSEKALILDKLNAIKSKYDSYNSGSRSQPWLNDAWALLYEVRVKMDHSSSGCVVLTNVDTIDILYLTDITLSQLRPTIRVVITDFRGITVSTYGECQVETILPIVLYEKAVSKTGGGYTLTATADNHLSDNSHITQAEYYVSTSQSSIPVGAVAHSMTAVDGSFNAAVEQLTSTISSSYLFAGANYIWIRAQDADGHWSDYVKVKIPGYLHLKSIDTIGNVYITMSGYSSGSGSGAKYWVIATVKVVDDSGNAISGASVQGTWSGSYVATKTETTSAAGICNFETTHNKYSDWPTTGGYKVFTIRIGSITKSGYIWVDPVQTDTIRLSSGKVWVN